MRRAAFQIFFILLVVSVRPPPCPAAEHEPMRYIYAPPESAYDRRLDFRLAVLRAALDRTRDRYGPYVLEPADVEPAMSLDRQANCVRDPASPLTFVVRSTNPQLERDLTPVRIPIDRGLTGYRIFLVRRDDLPRFAAAHTLDDLRRFTYGAGISWLDNDTLRANEFRVVTGSDYEGLFTMLANHRFDAFPRGISEVLPEFQDHRGRIPDLAIEPTLVLFYPLPMYFWFPKSPAGHRLAERVQNGMAEMIADGTYDRLFHASFDPVLARLDVAHRRIFRIDNPYITPAAILTNPEYWFDPTAPTSRPSPDSRR